MKPSSSTDNFRAYCCSLDELNAAVEGIHQGLPERWTLPTNFSSGGKEKLHALLERNDEVIAACSRGGDGPRLLAARHDRPDPSVVELMAMFNAIGGDGGLVVSRQLEANARSANAALGGRPLFEHMPLRLYRFPREHVDRLQQDPRPVLRTPGAGDSEALAGFLDRFGVETGLGAPDNTDQAVEEAIDRGGIRMLEQEGALLAIAQRGMTPSVGQVRIGLVYVPERYRRMGHAATIVRAITLEVINDDIAPCLFTDAANEGTDALYKSIGYEPLEELVHLNPEP